MKLLPMKIGEAEAMEIVGRTTRKHSEKTWLHGTSDQVAQQLEPYVEAGVNLVCLLDILPFVLDVEDAMGAIARPIEVSGLLKQKLGADVSVA
jgi:alkanesulfonate monooxygenase SsuD/methylene tetrahydromethanopterin reductase-like flavin-dependent oxidoreductase (luciferase family)